MAFASAACVLTFLHVSQHDSDEKEEDLPNTVGTNEYQGPRRRAKLLHDNARNHVPGLRGEDEELERIQQRRVARVKEEWIAIGILWNYK